jgi:hypothetical protein
MSSFENIFETVERKERLICKLSESQFHTKKSQKKRKQMERGKGKGRMK